MCLPLLFIIQSRVKIPDQTHALDLFPNHPHHNQDPLGFTMIQVRICNGSINIVGCSLIIRGLSVKPSLLGAKCSKSNNIRSSSFSKGHPRYMYNLQAMASHPFLRNTITLLLCLSSALGHRSRIRTCKIFVLALLSILQTKLVLLFRNFGFLVGCND